MPRSPLSALTRSVCRAQGGAQQSGKKSKLVPSVTGRLETEVLKVMKVPEEKIKWALKELLGQLVSEDDARTDKNALTDQKCRRHISNMKLMIREKIITGLLSVHPDEVGKSGKMEKEVIRRVGLQPGNDGYLKGPASQLMSAARYLSSFLKTSWAPSVHRELSEEAGVLREPAHEHPVRTDSINPPHRSRGSRSGTLGRGGDESGLLVAEQHVGCERRARGLTVGGGGRRRGHDDGGVICGGATC